MISFDTTQLQALVSHHFWPAVRILAVIGTAPILSEKVISRKVKVGLALLIAFLLGPSLPEVAVSPGSAGGIWLILQQVLIGSAIGITAQLVFVAVRLAGEVIGLQMGLSFATFFDPFGGPNTPMIARILNLMCMLLFLSFNGHLWLISILADSFQALPISTQPLNGDGFMAVLQTAGLVFSNGLMLGLPLITLLLALNISLGILNRLTPQFSIFVIGFPLTLTIGMLALTFLMHLLAPFTEHLMTDVFHRLTGIFAQMR